jgi:hypothetical protein
MTFVSPLWVTAVRNLAAENFAVKLILHLRQRFAFAIVRTSTQENDMKILTIRQEKLLDLAIQEAEGWEGSLVGNPDPEPLEQFQKTIAEMKAALKVVSEQQKALRDVRRKMRAQGDESVTLYCAALEGYGCVDLANWVF